MRTASLALIVLALTADRSHAHAVPSLGFEALAAEEEIGLDVTAARDRLTGLVSTLRGRLSADDGPRQSLRTIAEALRGICPRYVPEAQGGLYSRALADGTCDCDVLTLTYLTIGEAAGLPLSAVFLPGHVLVQWDDRRTRLYWETTAPGEVPAWYVETLVPEGAERTYLQPQSREQMHAHVYQVRATYQFEQGDTSGALADYATAERLNPAYVLTYLNRGRAHLLLRNPEAAAADFDRALALDPTLADGLYGRAVAHVALGRAEVAVRDLGDVLDRYGPAADALHVLGVAHAKLGQDRDALRAFDDALEADPAFAFPYEARGDLHARAGRTADARRDYRAFLRLAPGTDAAATLAAVREKLRALPEAE